MIDRSICFFLGNDLAVQLASEMSKPTKKWSSCVSNLTSRSFMIRSPIYQYIIHSTEASRLLLVFIFDQVSLNSPPITRELLKEISDDHIASGFSIFFYRRFLVVLEIIFLSLFHGNCVIKTLLSSNILMCNHFVRS